MKDDRNAHSAPSITDPDSDERLRDLSMATISVLPVVGGALSIAVSRYWIRPWDRKVSNFLETLVDDISRLNIKIHELEPDHLQLVRDVAASAASAASRAIGEAKLRALRNAVTNMATTGAGSDTGWAAFMVDYVDRLTQEQLVVLAMIEDPPHAFSLYPQLNPGTLSTMWVDDLAALILDPVKLDEREGTTPPSDLSSHVVTRLRVEWLIGSEAAAGNAWSGRDSVLTIQGRLLRYIIDPEHESHDYLLRDGP